MSSSSDAFNAMLAADAQVIVAGEFSESITYINRLGVRRVISAVVFRDGVRPLPGSSQARTPSVVVEVANDLATGIASSELEEGEQIELDFARNGKLKRLSIRRSGPDGKWNVDAGMIRLELN